MPERSAQLCIVLAVGPGDRGSDRSRLDHYRHPLKPATVLGIVLVLPAAKAAVGLFLIIGYRSGNREDYDAIVKLAGSAVMYWQILS